MFDCSIRAGVHTSAAFDAFFNVFRDCFSIDDLEDFNGASGHAFPCSFAFIIVNGNGDISFFEFFFHWCDTSFISHSVTPAIILDFVSSYRLLVKKYQGSFIKNHSERNQKANHLLFHSY